MSTHSTTPSGVHPRPPQRSLSSATIATSRPSQLQTQQPPPPIRSASHQYPSSSPSRRDFTTESSPDLPDGTPGRHGFARMGSKLRLELSSVPSSSAPSPAMSSPAAMTPSSRALGMLEAVGIATMSPGMTSVSQQDFETAPTPLPMPRRRPPMSTQQSSHLENASITNPPQPAKKEARPKPYTVEIPTASPRLAPAKKTDGAVRQQIPSEHAEHGDVPLFSKGLYSGHADFTPWNGNHFEDEWSTEAIQKGTLDRGSQTEASSARALIFPALKQKSGLNALSTIYMGVLSQRRQRGIIKAPSTFKPPPRVTLTDTKREVWLKDLANSAISLRRLSRTIPHGIRGRTLLDQCLHKNVPTERAVWLAKCVGANEIRAVKRKGVGGAVVMGGGPRWVRDWTIFVEQFVEAVASAFGEPDWKENLTYAIRLATNLYTDQLLDHHHYLDWVTTSLENSSQARLPLWMLVTQIYLSDLMRSRRFARRIVLAILRHLDIIQNDPDRDILAHLSSRLSAMMRVLLEANPESFIQPDGWLRYHGTVAAFLSPDDDAVQGVYAQVRTRNSRLVVANTSSPPGGHQQLVRMLDAAIEKTIDRDFCAKCWASSDDKNEIIGMLVEWATSSYRPGLARIYLALNVLRSWSSLAGDLTMPILAALDRLPSNDLAHKEYVYSLVTDLVRDGLFSVPRYMQWLIARGGYTNAAEIDPVEGRCLARLLVEMPLHSFNAKWKNERANLLRRAGHYSTDAEEDDSVMALKCINHVLGLPLPADDPLQSRKPMPLKKLLTRIKKSAKPLRSCVGAHVRDAIIREISRGPDVPIAAGLFTSVRAILEAAGDYTMLTDVIKACMKTEDAELLAVCAETVDTNLHILMALDVASGFFDSMLERSKIMSVEQGVVARPFLAALVSLAQHLRGNDGLASQLRQELLESDRSSAIDVCSPVSDNNLGHPTSGGQGDVSEEIDKLLSNGNIIDQPTMNRLFRKIVPRLEASWAKGSDGCRTYASLLKRLRVFDIQHFDRLISDWISHIKTLSQRADLAGLFPMLVTLECVSVSTLLRTANATIPPMTLEGPPGDDPMKNEIYVQELLHLLLSRSKISNDLSVDEAYRFLAHQLRAVAENPNEVVILIRNAVLEQAALQGTGKMYESPLKSPPFRHLVLDTLRGAIVADFDSATQSLGSSSLPPEARGPLRELVTSLLENDETDGSSSSFDHVLGMANELTMPFCQLKLNLDLSTEDEQIQDGQSPGTTRFESFAQAMDRAIEARNIVWTRMLPCLNDDITRHLKSQAHSRFLDLIPSSKSEHLLEDATDDARIHMARNLQGVVEAIISGQPPSKTSQLSSAMAEKLTDLWEILSSKDGNAVLVQAAVLEHWLPVLLKFLVLYHASAVSPKPTGPAPTPTSYATVKTDVSSASVDVQARITIILAGVLLELEGQNMSHHTSPSLTTQIFDIALLFADALPDDACRNCARAVLHLPGAVAATNTSSDPRLYYLFSTEPLTPADGFLLAQGDKSPSARGMGAKYGIGPAVQEKLSPYVIRRWELLSEPTPNVGENDTSLSLGLFEAIKL